MFGFALAVVLGVAGAISVVGGPSHLADARCDMIEINHYMPDSGDGFKQVIAWDWSPDYRRWHAQQWLILTEWSRRGDVVSCAGDGVELRIRSSLFRETWTQHDPERENQKFFPCGERRKVW